ncbi:hypothetical protein L204_105890 [Cryptococcus depauperatus]
MSSSPSETDTLLSQKSFFDDPNQHDRDRPVQLGDFSKNVERCKSILGVVLPITLGLEVSHLTMSLSEALGDKTERDTRQMALEGQMWADVLGVLVMSAIVLFYLFTLVYPISIKTVKSSNIRNLALHRRFCTTLFLTLIALVIVHLLPGITYTIITHLSSPSLSARHSTIIHHLRSVFILLSLIAAGGMRRGPRLYCPPPKLGTGFGLNEEKEDKAMIIKLTATEENNGLSSCSATTLSSQEEEQYARDENQSNVFDYRNSSMLNLLSLCFMTPLARLSINVDSLSQSDLPVMEEHIRNSSIREYAFSDSPKNSELDPCHEVVTNWMLVKSLWAGKGTIIVLTFFLEVIRNFVSFLQIAALHEVLQSFNQPYGSDKSYAYLMCWGMFAGQAVEALLSAYCGVRENYLLHVPIKMTLASMLFAKILRTTDAKATEAHNVKDDDKQSQGQGRSQVMNLLTIDTGTIAGMATHLWNFTNGIITLLIGAAMLYSMLGVSALAGIVCVPLGAPPFYLISQFIYRCDKEWARARDARTGALKEFLLGFKVIKLNAFEPYFMRKVRLLREREVMWQRWRFTLGTCFNILAEQLPVVAILVTFFFHTKVMGRPLDPATAFVASNIFNRVKDGLGTFPQIVQVFLTTKVSLDRLSKYLNQPEIDKERWTTASATIVCENATISWPAAEEDTTGSPTQTFKMQDVNFQLPEGKLTLLCGPLGTGKSLLLRAFLGEAKVEKGRVVAPRSLPDSTPTYSDNHNRQWTTDEWLTDSVAYAPQQSFIRHGTIRDNVLFGQPMWRDRYRESLRQAALLPDLEVFNDGDLTEVGEHGVTLSGGQKARVNLARCLYSRARTVYLDDILSAVDAHTAQFIYAECLRGSLLMNRTVVLVSHHVNLILPAANYLICLNKKGQVEQACPTSEAELAELTAIPEPVSPVEEEQRSPKAVNRHYEERDESSHVSRHIYREEHKSIGRVAISHYMLIFRTAGGLNFWLILAGFYIGHQAANMSLMFWLEHWTSDMNPAHLDHYLSIYALLILVTTIFGSIKWIWLYGIRNMGFYSSGSKKIHEMLLKRVFEAPLQFFETTPQGRLLNIFGQDVYRLDSSTADSFGRTSWAVLTLSTSAGVVFVKAPTVALISLIFGLPLYWVSGHLNKLRADIRRLTSRASSPLYSLYNETIDGVVMIRAFGQNMLMSAAMKAFVNMERGAWTADWAVYNWVRAMIRSIASIAVSATGFILVRQDLHPAQAAVVLSFAMMVSNGLFGLMELYSDLEQTFVSAERVNQYITMPDHETDEGIIPGNQWPSHGEIVVNGLCVRYAADLPDVLNDISFTIKTGMRVGLVGSTGSGKSTLALSLFRAVEPHQGQIQIDGIDISKISLPELRGKLNMVAQDGILCSGTLREALDVIGTKDDYEIYEALRRVHLLSDNLTREELDKNPFANLDTYVAIEGANFSQGQRQLLCLARALLKNSKILVMDEATSSVDFEMDAKITATIKECFAGTTMLVIAHRLATIMRYDQVLVLDKGRIIESGEPSQLIQDSQSAFHGLCMAQGQEEFDSLLSMARI